MCLNTPGEVSAKDLVGILRRVGVGAKLERMKPEVIKRNYGLADSEFFEQEEIEVIKARV